MALVLTGEEVRAVLNMAEAIDVVEGSLIQSALGQVIQPVRSRLFVPGYQSRMLSMPAFLEGADIMGMKIIGAAVGNVDRGLPGLVAMVVLCDPATGRFLAIMDGTFITEVRTAAASAVATKYLALPDARVLGILGAGVQARGHLWALSIVRPIQRVKLHDIVAARAARFKEEMEERFGFPVEVCASAEPVVRDSDVVVTVTSSRTPVLQGAWLKEGAHVNAVGASSPDTRELDSEAVCRAKVVADSLASLFAEAGDVLIPISEGRMTRERVYGEIGEIAAGRKPGRVSSEEITIFKSLGIAAEDVATAKLVYERAREGGLGIEVSI